MCDLACEDPQVKRVLADDKRAEIEAEFTQVTGGEPSDSAWVADQEVDRR